MHFSFGVEHIASEVEAPYVFYLELTTTHSYVANMHGDNVQGPLED